MQFRFIWDHNCLCWWNTEATKWEVWSLSSADCFDEPLSILLLSPPLGLCQQPHAHSPRLLHSLILSPFTNKPLHISTSALQLNKKLEREKSGQVSADAARGMMDLLTMGFMAQCVWTHTCWEAVPLDKLHTHLQHTRKFSIGSVCVSRPRGRSEDPDSISYMPSIPSSWVGERTLRLDNEPVTSNTRKTQLCIWKSALIRLFFFIHWFICKCICSLCFFSQFKDELLSLND